MASQTTINELIAYYENLLIIQYNDLPKAQATIGLLAETIIASGIFLDIMAGFNIDPCLGATAVGVQLDIIGKYVGVNRYYTAFDLANYFAIVTYSEYASLPTSPPAFGFSTYATFGNNDYNGSLIYADITTDTNALSDEDFLTLIRFQILINSSNFSYASLEAAVNEYLAPQVRFENSGNMGMVYFITAPLTPLLNAMLFNNLFPSAMCVTTGIVQGVNGLMFSFADYTLYESPFGSGFSTYANYGTLAGQTVTYAQISGE